MKLLILTQKVDENDPVLGFFHRWIEEFAKYCEKVTVVCLEKGEYHLPENVKVLSLGKENRKINYTFKYRIKYVINFYKYIWRERKNYDKVFVHMNPEYVVLGGVFWRLFRKKIALWYTHKNVDLKLRIAEVLTNKVFTASKESFQLKSNKIEVLGHGIDIDSFNTDFKKNKNEDSLNLLHIGRITKIKNIDILIQVVKILKGKFNKKINLFLVGGPATKDDELYFEEVKNLIKKLELEKEVKFLGYVPNRDIFKFYEKADISLNLTPTGGVDKVVLESMASKTLVFTSNKAFKLYFGKYEKDLIFKERDSKDLASKIIEVLRNEKKKEIEDFLYKKVLETSDLEGLIKRMLNGIER